MVGKHKKMLSAVLAFLAAFAGSLMMVPQALGKGYQQTFSITAYYSPQPDQQYFVTGSYDGDRRLNGNGVMGADRTPVYEGLIAAPGHYAFGTKISCAPFFAGEVHDRGGAIVKSGVRNNPYDRLDIWAGSGEEAMKKALYWGKRSMTCTVYEPSQPAIDQFVNLPYGQLTADMLKFLKTSTAYGHSKYEVLLKELGYNSFEKNERIAFQIRNKIIASEKDPAAGIIGPGTQNALNKISAEISKNLPQQKLEMGSKHPSVIVLQQILKNLGYLKTKPTGNFGEQTKDALVKFQIKEGIIEDKNHIAAGFVGPGTLHVLRKHLLSKYQKSAEDQKLVNQLTYGKVKADFIEKAHELAKNKPEEKATIRLAAAEVKENPKLQIVRKKLQPIVAPFDRGFNLGERSPQIVALQEVLQKEGFFSGTAFLEVYGPKTQQAVMAFQKASKIIASRHDPDAGILGSKTLSALNRAYYLQQFSAPTGIAGKIRAPAIQPDDLNIVYQY